jgi:hypothetical protein
MTMARAYNISPCRLNYCWSSFIMKVKALGVLLRAVPHWHVSTV